MEIIPKKKNKIDYDDNEDQDWFSYLHENIETHTPLGSPFPGSSWSYERRDSLFDHEDGLKKPDDELHWEIMRKLYENKCVDASLIVVIVLNGNVQLNGKVRSEEAKKNAERVVTMLPGVWRVENKLIVEQPS
ncbi:BON domain-containing protein [Peredibacter starrii]|uniref:BON domain-containing protein n=1 Tax=Peredibacter starrii TaxID=28202 RepID=A0AAX4HU65_9BACT|nr:BON domain-containing protein [Peredibacter starrii]WPU66854.1 BON domain-containing protein [Peredibacter starrii]